MLWHEPSYFEKLGGVLALKHFDLMKMEKVLLVNITFFMKILKSTKSAYFQTQFGGIFQACTINPNRSKMKNCI